MDNSMETGRSLEFTGSQPSRAVASVETSITEGRGAGKMAYHVKVLATNLTALEVVL